MNAIRQWMASHPGLSSLVLILAVCAAAEVAVWTYRGTLRGRAAAQRRTLARTERLAEEYRALRAETAASGARLESSEGFTLAAVQRAAPEAVRQRLTESNSEAERRDEALIERLISLKLNGVTRRALAEFLLAVESLDPAIRTKTLRLTPNKDEPSLLDASVTFSAYEQVPTTSP